MFGIKLKTHKNAYVKEQDLYGYVKTITKEEPFEVHSLVGLQRYNILSREEALQYLQHAAEQAEHVEGITKPLEHMLSRFPEKLREELKKGEGPNVNHILDACGFPSSNISQFALEHSYIPVEMMQEPSQNIGEYDRLLGTPGLLPRGLGSQFVLAFTLTNEGGLPDKNVIDYYVSNGVWGAPEMSVNLPSPGEYDREQVQEVVDEMYATFKSPRKIQKVRDLTEMMTGTTLLQVLSMSMQPGVMIVSGSPPDEEFPPENPSGGKTIH